MKYLMCVGAGIEQVPGIKLAQKKGYKVVAIDGDKNAVGLNIADVGIHLDIKDESNAIRIAHEYDVRGIIPTPIGRYLTTVGAINDALKLRGISRISAVACTDKVRQNRLLFQNNIRCAMQGCHVTKDDILQSIYRVGLPCILKPRYGAGSRAVKVISCENEIERLLQEHLDERGDDETLIESLMLGDEYGVDALIKDSVFELILVRGKRMTALPYRQELEYQCPANISELQYNNIFNTLSSAVKALALDNCLLHADILVEDNQCYVIELSGRPSGYFLSQKVVPYVTGINFLEQGINIVLDETINLKYSNTKYLAISFLDFVNHDSDQLLSNEILEKLPYIIESKVNFEFLRKGIKNGRDVYNIGYVLINGNSHEELTINIQKLKKFFNKG
ncbi:acetyl-CoA carboxylase biotin carboxylase subunit family protein [Shewanella sp. NFH-SH190041]|uniref:ATP-grasp domain-containing protein n=1 Tax=Shewanella sp. NFH-SH190041 TaxID=2950245 RepID=UPI0021C28A5F|nr:ATP-grasp domain-containing protein [Shewanella sp. NFH-SH190041]